METARPRLRPHLQAGRDSHDLTHIYLTDRLGLSAPERLTPQEFALLEQFDGQHSLADMGGDGAASLVRRLDAGLFLDTPPFRAVADGPVRPPRCIGCYEGEPDALREQLRGLFTHPRGPGLPGLPRSDGRLRAALVPHMDYQRGGPCYGWGFKEIFEQSNASLFVIIGTSHYSTHRFTLTRKAFATPLGVAPTDQRFVDRLVALYGPGLFDDEWLAHFPEHSIELEVVLLQYLYEGRRDLRIVPLVVGSLHDCVATGESPLRRGDVARMVEALRHAEAEAGEPVCTLISGDLAHIGPKFNRGEQLTDALLAQSRDQDEAILAQAEAADPLGYFKAIAAEHDARNICGLSPTFTTLAALRPSSGKRLFYDRYIHPQGHESVSFASVGFYG